jgi:hypothetical protein
MNFQGEAVGHQGGIVVPKGLNPYFPQLSGKISAAKSHHCRPLRKGTTMVSKPTINLSVACDAFSAINYRFLG